MQLQQNIPTLGGLGEVPQRSRRDQLAADGERARRDIAALLGRARWRVTGLALARAAALLLAGLSLALLAGALLAAVNGAVLAQVATLVLSLSAFAAVAWFCLPRPSRSKYCGEGAAC